MSSNNHNILSTQPIWKFWKEDREIILAFEALKILYDLVIFFFYPFRSGPIKFSIFGKLHIGPGMVLAYCSVNFPLLSLPVPVLSSATLLQFMSVHLLGLWETGFSKRFLCRFLSSINIYSVNILSVGLSVWLQKGRM